MQKILPFLFLSVSAFAANSYEVNCKLYDMRGDDNANPPVISTLNLKIADLAEFPTKSEVKNVKFENNDIRIGIEALPKELQSILGEVGFTLQLFENDSKKLLGATAVGLDTSSKTVALFLSTTESKDVLLLQCNK